MNHLNRFPTSRPFRSLAAALAAAVMLPLAGCSDAPPGPRLVPVTGTVSYDGKPLPDGDIMFVPADKSVGPEATKIKDGKYSFKAREGKNRVEVTASRPVPGKKGPMGEDAFKSYIPTKYNQKSELTAEVSAGSTSHQFELKK